MAPKKPFSARKVHLVPAGAKVPWFSGGLGNDSLQLARWGENRRPGGFHVCLDDRVAQR